MLSYCCALYCIAWYSLDLHCLKIFAGGFTQGANMVKYCGAKTTTKKLLYNNKAVQIPLTTLTMTGAHMFFQQVSYLQTSDFPDDKGDFRDVKLITFYQDVFHTCEHRFFQFLQNEMLLKMVHALRKQVHITLQLHRRQMSETGSIKLNCSQAWHFSSDGHTVTYKISWRA